MNIPYVALKKQLMRDLLLNPIRPGPFELTLRPGWGGVTPRPSFFSRLPVDLDKSVWFLHDISCEIVVTLQHKEYSSIINHKEFVNNS